MIYMMVNGFKIKNMEKDNTFLGNYMIKLKRNGDQYVGDWL